jgi:DNA-directed RNA polymerase subunit RPC12/RpoP
VVIKKWNEKCLICDSEMEYFFSKEYTQEPYAAMMEDIGKIDYYKCKNCGFVFSKTHYELSTKRWENLNLECHNFAWDFYAKHSNDDGFISSSPPYLQQATMIAILGMNKIIDTNKMLDYAGGDIE